ncbi:glycine-rich cell wall structural protein 1-like [Penaeus japonicus]|uniref:glycine-rich cell wall structural protein 1-like n=1 Tax=Penaeus japonicus TaxID=27405 RepID=UPI001C70FE48|nr:glycine-rich cell wall structural protein 1-like [Penaeus japonicus]
MALGPLVKAAILLGVMYGATADGGYGSRGGAIGGGISGGGPGGFVGGGNFIRGGGGGAGIGGGSFIGGGGGQGGFGGVGGGRVEAGHLVGHGVLPAIGGGYSGGAVGGHGGGAGGFIGGGGAVGSSFGGVSGAGSSFGGFRWREEALSEAPALPGSPLEAHLGRIKACWEVMYRVAADGGYGSRGGAIGGGISGGGPGGFVGGGNFIGGGGGGAGIGGGSFVGGGGGQGGFGGAAELKLDTSSDTVSSLILAAVTPVVLSEVMAEELEVSWRRLSRALSEVSVAQEALLGSSAAGNLEAPLAACLPGHVEDTADSYIIFYVTKINSCHIKRTLSLEDKIHK